MKKLMDNKFVWLLGVLVIAGSITYVATYGNKKWLLKKLEEEGKIPEGSKDAMSLMSTGELRKLLNA